MKPYWNGTQLNYIYHIPTDNKDLNETTIYTSSVGKTVKTSTIVNIFMYMFKVAIFHFSASLHSAYIHV